MPFIGGGGSIPPDLLERVENLEEQVEGGSVSAITISTTQPEEPTPVWIKLSS